MQIDDRNDAESIKRVTPNALTCHVHRPGTLDRWCPPQFIRVSPRSSSISVVLKMLKTDQGNLVVQCVGTSCEPLGVKHYV